MKQKYVIFKDEEKNQFSIKEFAELDKEILSLLCEETYDTADLEKAIEKGKDELIATLRTKNMYPPGVYAEAISEAVISMFDAEADPTSELFFEDKDLFVVEETPEPPAVDDEDGAEEKTDVNVDELLEDDDASDISNDDAPEIELSVSSKEDPSKTVKNGS